MSLYPNSAVATCLATALFLFQSLPPPAHIRYLIYNLNPIMAINGIALNAVSLPIKKTAHK
jgi:hypothetical protein